MAIHQIKNRWNNEVIFEGDFESLKQCVEAAVKARANLGGANLGDANLGGANLGDAYLGGANLGGANLGGANLGDANLGDAYLGGANLARANLGGANLGDAYLGGAYLGGANLGGANLGGAFGNSRHIITVQTDNWTVNYTATEMQIGCKKHEIAKWWEFDDETISKMDSAALDFWRKWKPVLQQIIGMNPAEPTKADEPKAEAA